MSRVAVKTPISQLTFSLAIDLRPVPSLTLDNSSLELTHRADGISAVTQSHAGSTSSGSASGSNNSTKSDQSGTSQSSRTFDDKIQAIVTRRIDKLRGAFDLLREEQGLDMCAESTQQVSKLWNVYCTGVKIFLLSRKSVHDSCNDLIKTALLLRRHANHLEQDRLTPLFWRVLFSKSPPFALRLVIA